MKHALIEEEISGIASQNEPIDVVYQDIPKAFDLPLIKKMAAMGISYEYSSQNENG